MEKNKKFMFVIIFLLVVLLATVVGVAIMALNMITSPQEPAAAIMADPGGVDPAYSRLVNLTSPMTINLLPSPDGMPHAVNINVSIALDTRDRADADLIERIAGSEAIIRDAVIYVLSNKRIDQISGSVNQDILREAIIQRLQSEFRTNIIHNVFFWDIYFM